jgi:beta-galactosidase GanA
VDEHHIAPDSGYPHNMTDLFGMEVQEFDPIPPDEENHLAFKGTFPASHLHPARLWCDLIEPGDCQVLGTYARDFYAGKPAMTMNTFGLVRAIYILAMIEAGEPVTAAWLQAGRWEVEIAGTRYPAEASLKPLYDPDMKRIKA